MINRLREDKRVYMLLSVLLAFMFWFYVRAAEDPSMTTTFHNIPVEYTGVNVLTRQGLTISGISEDEVDLKIEAPVSTLENLSRYRDDFWVTVDVSKCLEGENHVTYTPNYPTNFNPDGIVLLNRNPESVILTVEKLATRTLPIEFKLNGKVAAGYQVGTPVISPENVVISGSLEQVNQVARVVAILENNNLETRFAGDLPLKLLDASGNEITDLEVTLDTTTAYVILPVVVVKEVPLKVNFELGGGVNSTQHYSFSIEPKSIIVSGAEEDLVNLNEISLGSIELSKVISSSTVTKDIELDPSLENVSGLTSASITVTIRNLAIQTFSVENIQLTDAPSGFTATAVTQVKDVMVRGSQVELNLLDASQIRIVADISDLESEGIYSVPVRVYLDASSSLGVIGDYNITVNLSR